MHRVRPVFFVLVLSLLWIGCRTLGGPTPVEELVPSDTAVDLRAYQQSMPLAAGSTSVLILGTPHLAQSDRYPPAETDRVAETLSDYNPDMLVVEYLPPDHPRGKGRDYRPDLNLDALAARWDLSFAEADSLRRAYRAGENRPERPCRLAKAHVLSYDLANAHYHAHSRECPDLREAEQVREHFDWLEQGETARVGYPIARPNGIRRLVPFDYRGADVRWFIQPKILDAMKSGKVWALWSFWPVVPRVGSTYQEPRAHRDDPACYADALRFYNSPEHIGLQYWTYEEKIRDIDWQGADVGAEQTKRYWRRNRKMFGRMQEAIEKQDAERVLVIVGSGHKYFLDELTREAGYRWIDPREWLPESCAEGEDSGESTPTTK